jgi:uncharacterized metal-binding protein YceD (DUF177 family)
MKEMQPEFSRLLAVETIPHEGLVVEISANSIECKELAMRFDLVSIDFFAAKLRLRNVGEGPRVELFGHISAKAVQSCSVTLEPLPVIIDEEFELTFVPAEALVEEDDFEMSEENIDEPEPYDGQTLDLGEISAWHLSLALDPYPRKEGIVFEGLSAGNDGAAGKKENPFAKLAALNTKKP